MEKNEPIQGVFAAALTPLNASYQIPLDDYPPFLDYLARRGCHGALLFGTTGEGPSFSVAERLAVMRVARDWRTGNPEFRLLAGVGIPSLEETIQLTRSAFDIGMDAVLVLPPYYFRNVSDDGLFTWYQSIIKKAVPAGASLFGYHIPHVTGAPLSLDLLARLKDAFPDQFAGVKDSSADEETARALGKRFGKDLQVFNGTDPLFSIALENSAVGCITALANIISPFLRKIWDAFTHGEQSEKTQEKVSAIRAITNRYSPAPPLIKFLAAKGLDLPYWTVCPPLLPLPVDKRDAVWDELKRLPFDWR